MSGTLAAFLPVALLVTITPGLAWGLLVGTGRAPGARAPLTSEHAFVL
jgi:hypothetical protein